MPSPPSDDGTVRVWDSEASQCVASLQVKQAVRALAFNPKGDTLVYGLPDGTIVGVSADGGAELLRTPPSGAGVHVVSFSADGAWLAVGQDNGHVRVLRCDKGKAAPTGDVAVADNPITHVDFALGSSWCQITDSKGQLYYMDASKAKAAQADEPKVSGYFQRTTPMAADVKGIWGKFADPNGISSVACSDQLLASADQHGHVKIFSFPATKEGASHRSYMGHSGQVTNVKFLCSGDTLVSTGASDHAVFQWKVFPNGANAPGPYHSENEMSDDDNTEVELQEVDSDLEQQMPPAESRRREPPAPAVDSAQANNRAPPPEKSLELIRVHGYRGYDCRDNVFYDANMDAVVYHVAALGIVLQLRTNTQTFYNEHTDDILSLCKHPSQPLVATGQIGKDGRIDVWSMDTLKTQSVIKGCIPCGVNALDFHPAHDNLLAALGLDVNHCVYLIDWRQGQVLATARASKGNLYSLKFNPAADNELVTVGHKHIMFWSQKGAALTSKRGVFGSQGEQDTMLCCAYGSDGAVYSGAANGKVYRWQGSTLEKTFDCCQGPVYALTALKSGFVTGGKDETVTLWDATFTKKVHSFKVAQGKQTDKPQAVRAVAMSKEEIIVGTSVGDLLSVAADGAVKILEQGHAQGELWGLAAHPQQPVVATCSDDKSVKLWNLDTHQQVACKKLPGAARSCAFSQDGQHLAVGFCDGQVLVYQTEKLDGDAEATLHHRKEQISDIKFCPPADKCPGGAYMAVGSHNDVVDIYATDSWKRVGVCSGMSSYVSHFDWSSDGALIRVNSGAGEVLYFEAPKGKRIPLSAKITKEVQWATVTCVLGTDFTGMWPPGRDLTDVNAACTSRDQSVIATADDFALVKLFDFPCPGKNAKCKKYAGHSSHVTNVRFAANDKYLVSTGGSDTATMVWQFHAAENPAAEAAQQQQTQVDEDTDDHEDGYDSDVNREMNIDYQALAYNNRPSVNIDHKLEKHQEEHHASSLLHRILAPFQKTPAAPAKLQLQHIHGYRGYDSRNNVQAVDGDRIVYHVAAVGIVHHLRQNRQSFYHGHQDDILCLAVNPKQPSIVATGQIGDKAPIHVWQAESCQTLAVLQGVHTVGVCALSFSSNGLHLASVDVSKTPTIAVYRWHDGALIAKLSVACRRIFTIDFRPDCNDQFVTAGVKHLQFYSIAGSTLLAKRATVKRPQKMVTMLAVAFPAAELTASAAMNGEIWLWRGPQLERTVAAHTRPAFCLWTQWQAKEVQIVSGGKDGFVRVFDKELNKVREHSLDKQEIRSAVLRDDGSLLVGTESCSIVLIGSDGAVKPVTCGHADAVQAVVPAAAQGKVLPAAAFLTTSDDGKLNIWSSADHTLLSSTALPAAGRAVALSGDGALIAVGLANGQLLLYEANGLKAPLQTKRDRGTALQALCFSPDNKVLAVGSDGCVDFYSVPGLERVGNAQNLGSAIHHMDFAADGKLVKVENATFDIAYLQVPQGTAATAPAHDAKWASMTCSMGADLVGIWPKPANKDMSIDCVAVSHDRHSVVTGDNAGYIKVFPYPATEANAKFNQYDGHSEQVADVCFTADNSHVVSVGGKDCA